MKAAILKKPALELGRFVRELSELTAQTQSIIVHKVEPGKLGQFMNDKQKNWCHQ